MKSTQYQDEPDPSSLRVPSTQDEDHVSSSFGEVVVVSILVAGFILGVGLLLNEAIRETVGFFKQVLGN